MAINGNRSDRRTLAEINVTPLVDVMLVLLVIFMITAPLMKMGTNIDLPQAKLDPLDAGEKELIIQIEADQTIRIGKNSYRTEELAEKIGPIKKSLKPDAPIYVAADKAVPYGFVMKVLEALKAGGLDSFGLMTRPPEEGSD